MKKKIISFCLWGDKPLYVNGVLKNIALKDDYYPDWTIRFYIDKTVNKNIVDSMLEAGCEVIMQDSLPDGLGMFWRFLPMEDPDVERFIVRDTDSIFTQREVDAVNMWIESGKPFHVIRDAEAHNVPILGGTWGAIGGCITNFKKAMNSFFQHVPADPNNPRGKFHGMDQVFLAQYVWPLVKDHYFGHYRAGMEHLKYSPNDIELPELEKDGHYVGMVA